jgi:hypothetical protein
MKSAVGSGWKNLAALYWSSAADQIEDDQKSAGFIYMSACPHRRWIETCETNYTGFAAIDKKKNTAFFAYKGDVFDPGLKTWPEQKLWPAALLKLVTEWDFE